MENKIYLDNAATFRGNFNDYNANSLYADEQKEIVEEARKKISYVINCTPEEIFFTSGGCEANSWALQGVARASKDRKKIITTPIEHASILNCCKFLEEEGYEIVYLKVDEFGRIDFDDLHEQIDHETLLVSVMHVNNEIGTIQNISDIGLLAHEYGALFHTDCVQSFGKLKINVRAQHIDLLSASGHKNGAPYGIGFLYIKDKSKIKPLIFGGSQEQGLRGGTTNVEGIKDFAESVQLSEDKLLDSIIGIVELNLYFNELVKKNFSEFEYRFNSSEVGYAGIISIGFKGINAEDLVIFLEGYGVLVSAGSACSAGEKSVSHVLKAIGVPEDFGTIRISLSSLNTREEIEELVRLIRTYINLTKETE